MGEMPRRDARGHEQPATMLDLDTLPGWMFSIDARKVKEQVRDKLARYQREAARVLAARFSPGFSSSPAAAGSTPAGRST